MSNTFNDGTGAPPINQPATPLVANASVAVQDAQQAEALPRATAVDEYASRAESTMGSEVSRAAADSGTSNGATAVDRDKARAVDPIGSSSLQHRPGPVLTEPFNPPAHQASAHVERATTKEETQTGGNEPPRRPPSNAISSAPDGPEPVKRGAQPPHFDIEEFIREVEENKRGAKLRQEIKCLGDEIKELANRGIPIGPIYKGLKRRELVTCSQSRFGEICGELFPDLFGSSARRNA
jgi:hypothetical protein